MNEPAKPEILPVDDALLPLVQHLRYRVYVAEMGFAMAGADARARRLISPADALGESFALFLGDELAGSVQLIGLDAVTAQTHFAALDLPRRLPDFAGRAMIVSKLVTDPRHRGQATLTPLLQAVFGAIVRQRARYVIILAEDRLTEFYRSMGFVLRESGLAIAPFGSVNLMVLDMEDPRHREGRTLIGWMFRAAFQPPA